VLNNVQLREQFAAVLAIAVCDPDDVRACGCGWRGAPATAH